MLQSLTNSYSQLLMAQKFEKFEKAHQQDFKTALAEIKAGKKISHWMWYIFPQLKGLGFSETSRYYALENLDEAQDFLNHPVLGNNLVLISTELLNLKTNDARSVFGSPDDMKLHSSMTLFSLLQNSNPIFKKVLDQYFSGKLHQRTVELLSENKK
jgi:uncharacterized protein (DUF1810 family)